MWYYVDSQKQGGEIMAQADISKEMIRGYTGTIVLNILAQGDSYGYQISKDVTQLSGGDYEINEATLYTVFRRLAKNGSVEGYWGDETQGSRRKYYRITDQGMAELAAAKENWNAAKKVMDELILGKVEQHNG
jgi:PadR family transcriptional regulator PadR